MNIVPKQPAETARHYAMRMIKNNIISLNLAPGSMVSEKEIAEQLLTSRTPVREALIELSRINLVEILPQKGSRISLINYDMVEQSRFLRLVLEREVVRLLCSRQDTLDFTSIEENLRLQAFYLEYNNPERLLQLDNFFHELLFELADKSLIYAWMLDGLNVHFDRVRKMSLEIVKDIQIVDDHVALIDAIRGRDIALAESLIEHHLSRYLVDEKEIRSQFPEYFC
jgi:DNA-binding GntR family transcriptional regulator